jgi:CheY-like chemotaxis protein
MKKFILLSLAFFVVSATLSSGMLKQVVALDQLHACATQEYTAAALDACAQRAHKKLINSAEEKDLMFWMFDLRTLPAGHFSQLRQQLIDLSSARSIAGICARIAARSLAVSLAVLVVVFGLRRRKANVVRTKRVLIIDDDSLFAKSAGRLLATRGFEVDYAFNAAQARKQVKSGTYDQIFCDYFLDDEKGTELCDRLLDDDAKERCVIVTGAGLDEVAKHSRHQYKMLAKPCSADQLLQMAMN